MRLLRSKVEAAAVALARASNPQDEIFVLNFNDKARIDVPFTSDVGVLETGIGRVDSIGGTAMWDAIDQAQHYLTERGTRDRKVLLVITDGIDNASMATRDQVEKQAEQRDTVIFAVGLFGDEGRVKHGRHELDQLADRTGGIASYPAGIDQIGEVAPDRAAIGTNDRLRAPPARRSTALPRDSRHRGRAEALSVHPRRYRATKF